MTILCVAKSRDDIPFAPGVYVFFDGHKCRYVGESINIRKRIAGHERKKQLIGCEVWFLPCSDHKLVEQKLILELNPSENGHRAVIPSQHQSAKISAIPDPKDRMEALWRHLFGEEAFWIRP